MDPCPPLTTSLGPSLMLPSISKCVMAEEDPINTLDHLPILAQLELCFHPYATPSPEIAAWNWWWEQCYWRLLLNVTTRLFFLLQVQLCKNENHIK